MRWALMAPLLVLGSAWTALADDEPELRRGAPQLQPSHDVKGEGGFYEGGDAEPTLEPLQRAPEQPPVQSRGYYEPRATQPYGADRRPGFGHSRWFGPGSVPPSNTRRYDRGRDYYDPPRIYERVERDVIIVHRSAPYPSRWYNPVVYGPPRHVYRPYVPGHFSFSLGVRLGPHVGLGWGAGCW